MQVTLGWLEELRLSPSQAAVVLCVADDDVVEQGTAEDLAGIGQAPSDGKIAGAGIGLTAWMIMHGDAACGLGAEGIAKKRAWSGVGAVDVTTADLQRAPDQATAYIQRQAPEFFMAQRREIVDEEAVDFFGCFHARTLAETGSGDASSKFKGGAQLGRLGRAKATALGQLPDIVPSQADQTMVLTQEAGRHFQDAFVAAAGA